MTQTREVKGRKHFAFIVEEKKKKKGWVGHGASRLKSVQIMKLLNALVRFGLVFVKLAWEKILFSVS